MVSVALWALVFTGMASGGIAQNTTLTITLHNVTSVTTIQYTDIDSTHLRESMDLQGDNNSYVSTWELVKYDTAQRRQIMEGKHYLYTLKNVTVQKTVVDVTTSPDALGNTSATRAINTTVTIRTKYTSNKTVTLKVRQPHRSVLLVQKNLSIEESTPQVEIKNVSGYYLIEIPSNSTLTLRLSTQILQDNLSEEKTLEEEPERKTNNTLFIVSILFFLLIILLILLHRIIEA
jgi:hypothetical protein